LANTQSKTEYKFATSFVFERGDDIDKGRYTVHKEAKDEIYIRLERKLRRRPLVGMKQPTPIGAMLGWEGALEIQNKGKTAAGYRWKFYRSGNLEQEGRTDELGEDSLEMDIEPDSLEYRLEVFSPVINEEDDSGNKTPEESDGPDQHNTQTTPVRSPE